MGAVGKTLTASALSSVMGAALLIAILSVAVVREIVRQRPSSPGGGWALAPLLVAFGAVVIARFLLLSGAH